MRISSHIDVYVISYPKSGRTWLRVMLGKYLSLKYKLPEEDILATEKISSQAGILVTAFTHDDSAMLNMKPWSSLSSDKTCYENKRVVLLGRDLKDTLASAYHQATRRIKVFDGTISEFIRDERFGIRKLLAFYNIWQNNIRTPKSFMFLSYEGMHGNTRNQLRNVLGFIGAQDIDEDVLSASIEYATFESMKRLEQQGRFGDSILQPKDWNDENSYKVRRGKIGGYHNELNVEDIAFIDDLIAGFDFGVFEECHERT